MKTVFRNPPCCTWCFQEFGRSRRAWLCACGAVVCRPKDRACYALHMASAEHGALL